LFSQLTNSGGYGRHGNGGGYLRTARGHR
jgi:hypothetical protein